VGEVVNLVQQFRESHHRIAQMLAMGCTPSFIRQHTGVSHRRLTLLQADPTFNELIVHYEQKTKEIFEETQQTYADLMSSNMLSGERHVRDHFEQAEDNGELIPILTANRISQDRADRLGFGKNSTVQVKHDFASLLDRAIARSTKVIEHDPAPGLDSRGNGTAVLEAPPRVAPVPLGDGGIGSQEGLSPQPIPRRRIA